MSRLFFATSYLLTSVIALLWLPDDCFADDDAELKQQATLVTDFVETHCLDCHNSHDASGGLNLESLDFSPEQFLRDDFERAPWESMWRRLASRQMPPSDTARPEELEYRNSIEAITQHLHYQSQKFPQPGRTDSIRRLNRTEYRNAIRDLLAIEIDVESLLPNDESRQDFDNITVN